MASLRRVVLVAFEHFQLLDLVGPAEVLDTATRLLHDEDARVMAGDWTPPTERLAGPGYELILATPSGGAVRATGGLRVAADAALRDIDPVTVDTLIVSGSPYLAPQLADRRLVAEIRRLDRGARRTCSVCSGSLLLAAAGLLNGRRATTHWSACEAFARLYPSVQVEPNRIFVREGRIITAAGVSAGMDLALALVSGDHGPEIARKAARWMVLFLQRPGGQSQFSERLALPLGVGSPIRTLVDEIVADPAADHRVPELARRAAMSERHLARVFSEQTRMTPGRFVERVRVEAARDALETSRAPVDTVAARCGFGSSESMRRAFLRVLGVGPREYRERFRHHGLEPVASLA